MDNPLVQAALTARRTRLALEGSKCLVSVSSYRKGAIVGERRGPRSGVPARGARWKGVAVSGEMACPDRDRWVRLVGFMLHAWRLSDD